MVRCLFLFVCIHVACLWNTWTWREVHRNLYSWSVCVMCIRAWLVAAHYPCALQCAMRSACCTNEVRVLFVRACARQVGSFSWITCWGTTFLRVLLASWTRRWIPLRSTKLKLSWSIAALIVWCRVTGAASEFPHYGNLVVYLSVCIVLDLVVHLPVAVQLLTWQPICYLLANDICYLKLL